VTQINGFLFCVTTVTSLDTDTSHLSVHLLILLVWVMNLCKSCDDLHKSITHGFLLCWVPESTFGEKWT